jgi:hypothetical protein
MSDHQYPKRYKTNRSYAVVHAGQIWKYETRVFIGVR